MTDFDPADNRAEIFMHYVAISRILGDLCQYITRKGEASLQDKQTIAGRMSLFLENLPEHLRLYGLGGLAQMYSLDIAQLHVPILATITSAYTDNSIMTIC